MRSPEQEHLLFCASSRGPVILRRQLHGKVCMLLAEATMRTPPVPPQYASVRSGVGSPSSRGKYRGQET